MEIDFLNIAITGKKFTSPNDTEASMIKHSQCIVVYVQDLLRKQNLI